MLSFPFNPLLKNMCACVWLRCRILILTDKTHDERERKSIDDLILPFVLMSRFSFLILLLEHSTRPRRPFVCNDLCSVL